MSRVKNEHYVPQFYLRNFCIRKNQIAVFDKSLQKSYFTTVKNVANENYFYDNEYIEKAINVDQFLEKFFCPLENKISYLFKRLIKSFDEGSFDELDQDSRVDLSIFLVYQFIRTKEYRERLNQMIKTFTQSIADEFIKSQGGDPSKFEIVTDDKILHTNMILLNDKVDEFAEILYNHVWIFLINKSSTEFITSDHPFVKKANVHHPFRSFTGLKSPGIEIAFPLSPKYSLLIADRNYFKLFIPFDGKLMSSIYENVIHYNSLQVINAYRFVYSIKNDFELAIDMIKEEPEIANPNRERVGIHKS